MAQVAQRVSVYAEKPMTEAYVSLIETGLRNPPYQRLADAWAKALNVPEAVVEYAAKGQWWRPVLEILHARQASPDFIKAVKEKPIDHLKEIFEYFKEKEEPRIGMEFVLIIKPDGTVDIAIIEALP